jgi:hypothetical protein
MMEVKKDGKAIGYFAAANIGTLAALFLCLTLFGIPLGLPLFYLSWKWFREGLRIAAENHSKPGKHSGP